LWAGGLPPPPKLFINICNFSYLYSFVNHTFVYTPFANV
jgi:hypothetical protein